jgi:hypothetical protein
VIDPDSDAVENKEASARRALESYQERRRGRRDDNTWFGDAGHLQKTVDRARAADGMDSRRASILEISDEDGVPRDLAELAFDIATEEGLDPAVGYELVRSGLGVAPPEGGVTSAPGQPEVDRYLPTWMFSPLPPDAVLRERMLRFSFRRLRSLLIEEGDPGEAFRRFANEPDVGHYGY